MDEHDQPGRSRNSIRSFKDLIVWQKGIDLAEAVYRHTNSFPKSEQYGLTSQMRRAVVSVPSNIAEGHSRSTRGEFKQSLGHAGGSLAELESQMILSDRLGFIAPTAVVELEQLIAETGRLPNALRMSLN